MNEFTPYFLAAITAGLVPGAVSLVRMRRDIDSLIIRVQAVENEARDLGTIRDKLAVVETHVLWIRSALEKK